MSHFYSFLGGAFIALSLLFLMGLLPAFARRFYPDGPGVLARAAAPMIFAGLAIACFSGVFFPAMLIVLVAGLTQIVWSRRMSYPFSLSSQAQPPGRRV